MYHKTFEDYKSFAFSFEVFVCVFAFNHITWNQMQHNNSLQKISRRC